MIDSKLEKDIKSEGLSLKTEMESEKRLDAFEKMLEAIQKDYEIADSKMKQLKAEGKE